MEVKKYSQDIYYWKQATYLACLAWGNIAANKSAKFISLSNVAR